jgi:acyl-[acyl-carrier-protein] desaturase
MHDAALLEELTPTAEQLYDRHLAQTREWFPHQLVPWELGPEVITERPWEPADSRLPAPVRSALYVNILTEDNLPYYVRDISRMFGSAGVWGEWVGRWTAEEARHSIVLRDYLVLTRALCPIELERGRMAQMCTAQVPEPPDASRGLAYLTLQELATRISHHNTGKLLTDEQGYAIMKRVAVDENYHYLFYRDLTTAAFEVDPSSMMVALDAEVRAFAMPGTGIPDFAAHSRAISRAGIYDFKVHYDQILVPVVLRHWGVESLAGLTAGGERARDSLVRHVEKVGRVASRIAERQAEQAEASAVTAV